VEAAGKISLTVPIIIVAHYLAFAEMVQNSAITIKDAKRTLEDARAWNLSIR
jgi:hypothetical protein